MILEIEDLETGNINYQSFSVDEIYHQMDKEEQLEMSELLFIDSYIDISSINEEKIKALVYDLAMNDTENLYKILKSEVEYYEKFR